MFLSIIISVYNLEIYITECLNSILTQDFEDYEVLLVDDGSTDRSSELCLQFAENYPRIKYFRKNNGGASSARNFGLEKAGGKYIIFMDGDDFLVGTSFFSDLYSKAENSPDFVLYGCYDYDHLTGRSKISRSNYWIGENSGLSKRQIIDELMNNENFPGAAWLFCVKNEFLKQNKIKFREGIKAEDLDWIFSAFQRAGKMAFLDIPYYMYRKNRPGSVTKTFDRKSIDGLLYFIAKWGPIVSNDPQLYRLLSIINFHYLLLVLYGKSLNSDDFTILEVNKKVLKYPGSKLLLFISGVVRIMGVRSSHQLFNLFTILKNAS